MVGTEGEGNGSIGEVGTFSTMQSSSALIGSDKLEGSFEANGDGGRTKRFGLGLLSTEVGRVETELVLVAEPDMETEMSVGEEITELFCCIGRVS